MVSDDGAESGEALSAGCSTALAIASVTGSNTDGPNVEKNVLDGNYATRWSGAGVGANLVAKLNATSSVCAVQVAWYVGNTRRNHFVIATSTDGKTYSNVVGQDSSGGTLGLETYPLPAARSALYVRVTVNGNTSNAWASLTELRLVGATAVGSVKPGPSNTGVPAGTTLTRLEGDQVIDASWLAKHPTGVPAGAGAGIMQNQDIYGSVTVRTPGFTLRRSRVHGKQSESSGNGVAVIFVQVGTAAADVRARVRIEDCEITPTLRTLNVGDGIFGYNFTALRNDIHHTIDGFGLLYFTDVESNYVHELVYFDHDSGHTNGTHNDVVQLHKITYGPVNGYGGLNTIKGNFFSAFIARDAGTPGTMARTQWAIPGQGWDYQSMSAFMVNQNQKNTVTDNWVEGGSFPVNALDSLNPGLDLGTWQRNRFDRMRYDNPGSIYPGAGSYNVMPRNTFGVKKGALINTGAGTANANTFESPAVTPGAVNGAEAVIRYL